MRTRPALVAALALVLVVAASSCSGGGDDDGSADAGDPTTTAPTTTTAPEPVEVDDVVAFEAVPDPIPDGEHGALLRYRRLPEPPDGAEAWRIMYLSTTVSGEPTVVTGVVLVPTTAAPDDGWLLVSVGHGSTGLADDCSPSASMETDSRTAIDAIVLAGRLPTTPAVLVVSDYEGQGGPGRHPFLVAESEGRSLLDAARAARALPAVADHLVPDALGLLGYSQGGHAVLAANELAPTWTPEAEVIGTVSGAPVTEVVDRVEVAVRSPEGSYDAAIMLAGQAAAHPDADLDAALTEEGATVVDAFDRSCDASPDVDTSRPALAIDPTTTEPWPALLRASEPGSVVGASPVLIIHSAEDESVPVEGSARYQERACAIGQEVERQVLPTGAHVPVGATVYSDGLTWLVARHRGDDPFASTCP